MKLATLRSNRRDGRLVIVSRDLTRMRAADDWETLQGALDDWAGASVAMRHQFEELNEFPDRFEVFDAARCAAPLPRAYQWLDASAYLNHVELVRRARGAEMPPSFLDDPLMYQGGSDDFLAAGHPIEAEFESQGVDLEAEVVVVTDDVALGSDRVTALSRIVLIGLANDITLRNLTAVELAKGFGFLQSKPATALAPVFVTPDELGNHWREGKLHLPLRSSINGERLGQPNAGVDMNFDFGRLISHASRTRRLIAGTIIGSGTVSNRDPSSGVSCLAEKRVHEQLDGRSSLTPFLQNGDRVRIEMLNHEGGSIFGAIDQEVRITSRG